MKQAGNVLRPVDDAARRLARTLIRTARHASLATLMPDTGLPLASRALVASDDRGHPLLLVSELAAHTRALLSHPSCSLLLGDVGDGDPLTHPRVSIIGRAERLEGAVRDRARRRFLARHPTAASYCDFADFHFFGVFLERASLNAGFARAYEMPVGDLVETCSVELADRLHHAVGHMNEDHADSVDAIAEAEEGAGKTGWRIVTADRSGFELAQGDILRRIFFDKPIETADGIRPAFVALAHKARGQLTSPIA